MKRTTQGQSPQRDFVSDIFTRGSMGRRPNVNANAWHETRSGWKRSTGSLTFVVFSTASGWHFYRSPPNNRAGLSVKSILSYATADEAKRAACDFSAPVGEPFRRPVYRARPHG